MPLFTDAMGRAQSVWGSLFPNSTGNPLAQENFNMAGQGSNPLAVFNYQNSGPSRDESVYRAAGGYGGRNPLADFNYQNPSPYRDESMFNPSNTAQLSYMRVEQFKADRAEAEKADAAKPEVVRDAGNYWAEPDTKAGTYAAKPGGYAVYADAFPLIGEAATAQKMDPALLRAVMEAEGSGGDPKAVSPAGAIGLMQLMPATAKGMGVDPYDPRANVMGGAAYLAEMLDRAGGDIAKGVGMYNAGPAGNLANSETAAYIPKVMALYEKYKGWKPDTVTNSAINQKVANQLPEQQSFLFAKAQSIMAQRLPYVYGGGRGTAPGLDCSSFVSKVYKEALGVNLIPQSDTSFGQTVAANGPAQPGDLVYFEYRDASGNRFPHMGMVYTARGGRVNIIHHTTYGGSNTTRVDDVDQLAQGLKAKVYYRRLPS